MDCLVVQRGRRGVLPATQSMTMWSLRATIKSSVCLSSFATITCFS